MAVVPFFAWLVICCVGRPAGCFSTGAEEALDDERVVYPSVEVLARSFATFLKMYSRDENATSSTPRTVASMKTPLLLPPAPPGITTVKKANAWVDHFLASHREDIRLAVGRIILPSQKIPVGPASISLSRGYLANLHKVFRIGDWELVRLDDTGQKLSFNLLLGIDHVEAGYQCDARLAIVGIRKWIRIRVDKVRIRLQMTQDFNPSSEDGQFEGENIVNLRANAQARLYLVGIHVDVRSLGFPFDQIFSLISTAVANIFRLHIQNLIKNPIRDFIRKISGHFW